MTLTDEIERLSELHAEGSLTDEEFAAAKAKLIAGDANPQASSLAPDVAARMTDLTRQNALLQLDHDWESQRQSFMMRGRYGSMYLPTTGGAITTGVVGVIAGGFLLVASTNSPNAGFVPLFAFIIAGICLFTAASQFAKAQAFEAAQRDYQERRAQIERGATGGGFNVPQARQW